MPKLDLLDKWEAPPISQLSKEIKKLYDTIKVQETTNVQLIDKLRTEMKQQIEEKKNIHHVELQKLHSLIEQKETVHSEFR